MLVRQILNAKPEGNVLTLPPGTPITRCRCDACRKSGSVR